MSASTELNIKSLLESNTKVFYKKDDHFTLPETYNGLGFRNLIFILFRIYEYFRAYQSSEITPKSHLIFVEEPEAHLHPQMQEVFIRQLDEIVTVFEETFNEGESWPIQFVVSTHSAHIANEADFSKVRYFLTKTAGSTKIKDLGAEFSAADRQVDKDFLHKYLSLTKCDLYFADKAILIEGATERILLPEIIKKLDDAELTTLRSKYLSVVEVGGAYMNHFYKFIDFLELKTLIVTDIDSVKRNDANTAYISSMFSDGTHTSNTGLSKWYGFDGYCELSQIVLKPETDKVSGCRRIAYQITEDGSELVGRSFEDAFILANLEKFNLNEVVANELETKVYQQAKNIGKNSKANFAIKYSIDETDWSVPKYITEGLVWLNGDNIESIEVPEIAEVDIEVGEVEESADV